EPTSIPRRFAWQSCPDSHLRTTRRPRSGNSRRKVPVRWSRPLPIRPQRSREEPCRRPWAAEARLGSVSGTARFNRSGPIRTAPIRAALRGETRSEPGAFGVAKAAGQMVVDHTDTLHEGVQRGRSAEPEAALL